MRLAQQRERMLAVLAREWTPSGFWYCGTSLRPNVNAGTCGIVNNDTLLDFLSEFSSSATCRLHLIAILRHLSLRQDHLL